MARGHRELRKVPGDYLSAAFPGEGPGLKEMPAEGAERVPHLQPSIAAGRGSSSPWDLVLVLVATRVPLQQLPLRTVPGWGGARVFLATHSSMGWHRGTQPATATTRVTCWGQLSWAGTSERLGCPTGSDAPSEGGLDPTCVLCSS